jgi:hypothetical protein
MHQEPMSRRRQLREVSGAAMVPSGPIGFLIGHGGFLP